MEILSPILPSEKNLQVSLSAHKIQLHMLLQPCANPTSKKITEYD